MWDQIERLQWLVRKAKEFDWSVKAVLMVCNEFLQHIQVPTYRYSFRNGRQVVLQDSAMPDHPCILVVDDFLHFVTLHKWEK